MKFAEFVQAVHRGLGHRIVAVDNAHLVRGDIICIQAGIGQGSTCGHVGILRFLRYELPQVARHERFQIGLRHTRTQGRTETGILTFLTEYDTATSFKQRLTHFIQRGTQA